MSDQARRQDTVHSEVGLHVIKVRHMQFHVKLRCDWLRPLWHTGEKKLSEKLLLFRTHLVSYYFLRMEKEIIENME
jgi:hypothetical protein